MKDTVSEDCSLSKPATSTPRSQVQDAVSSQIIVWRILLEFVGTRNAELFMRMCNKTETHVQRDLGEYAMIYPEGWIYCTRL